MKKILSILLLLITSFSFSQTKLNLSQIQYATGAGYIPYTDLTGKQTYSLLSTVSSKGTVKSNTLTTNYIPKAMGSDTIVDSNITDGVNGVSATSQNGTNLIYALNGSSGFSFEDPTSGNQGGVSSDNNSTLVRHDVLIELNSPSVKVNQLTASQIVYTDASKNLASVTLGSGLSLTSGTLSATNTSSTTILTASTNITISGSAPNYTISTPTQTTGLASTSSPTITSPTFSTSVTLPYSTANRVMISDSTNHLVSSSTTTTQLSYLDATSSIQTQLDAKRTCKNFLFTSFNPADNTVYYTPNLPSVAPNVNVRGWKFGKSGTVTDVQINFWQTVNGSSETVTLYLRNTTTSTDYLLGTFTSDFGVNTLTYLTFTGLNITINTTDVWTIKFYCPAWTTNPTGWQGTGDIYIK